MTTSNYLPKVTHWHDFRLLDVTLSLWRPVIDKVCYEAQISVPTHIEINRSNNSIVFILDQQSVIKIFPPFLKIDFDREVEIYHLLEERLYYYLPQLLSHGILNDQTNWPYLVLEFCTGKSLRTVFNMLNIDDKVSLAVELGNIIRIVHETPLNQAKNFNVRPETWPSFIDKRIQTCIQNLKKMTILPNNVITELTELIASYRNWLRFSHDIKLLHTDLSLENLLLVNRFGRWEISALLDWANSRVGIIEYEWVGLWFGVCNQDPLMFQRVLQTYDSKTRFDESFRIQLLVVTFIHEFGSEIVGNLLNQPGAPSIKNLRELQMWLWPPMIF